MRDFFRDLVPTTVLDVRGIDEAVLRSSHRLLTGGLSRFGFARAAFSTADMRSLPLAHLLDHRVRGPHTLVSPGTGDQLKPEGIEQASVAGLENWLGHMLEASDRRGARELVGGSLRLDPHRDALLLARLGGLNQAFHRACVRGRLGTAIAEVTSGRMIAEHEAALSLVARLLVYFGCFSVQLVATRAWAIDHLPFRQEEGSGPYREAALLKDLVNSAATINEIGAYMAGRRARYPNRALVSERKPLAGEWRAGLATSDDDARRDLIVFFDHIEPVVARFLKAAAGAKAIADVDNRTAHKLIYGDTAGEALSYAVDRLIQLRRHADDLVRRLAGGEEWRPLPRNVRDLPGVEDQDATTLLYVLRIVTLEDPTAAVGPGCRQALETDPSVSLVDMLDAHVSQGDPPGMGLRKTARRKLLGTAPSLGSTQGRAFVHRRHYDVWPEHWLQTARTKALPSIFRPSGDDLLDRKRSSDERKREQRPPNVRRASGKDRPRAKRRT